VVEAVWRSSRRFTGLARSTINRGRQDLDVQPLPKGRVRRAGGGRRSVCENDPGLIPALKRLVEPATLGDPMRPCARRPERERGSSRYAAPIRGSAAKKRCSMGQQGLRAAVAAADP
jgi:hypothetical protein